MRLTRSILLGSLVAIAASGPASAQETDEQPEMNFFLTSVGLGNGANLGGIDGADTHCQSLAEAAEAGGKTWRAYLSTDGRDGNPVINARDRIGTGPWYNYDGRRIAKSLSELHGDTLEEARNGNLIGKMTAVDERGEEINGVGDTPNWHDILTGSKQDGTAYTDGEDRTCSNWTSNSEGSAQVGHHDRNSSSSISWNSAHPSRGCSQEDLARSGGGGLFYCFAID